MTVAFQRQFRSASVVLDVEDAYAREVRTSGRHPRPIGPVRFTIVGTMAGAVRTEFAEPLELAPTRNPSGYQLFFDQVRLANGQTRRIDLPPATYILRVSTPDTNFYQTVERTDLTLPLARGATFAIDLLPGYAYPFPAPGTFRTGRGAGLVRGSFVNARGEGVEGGTVSITPQPLINVPGPIPSTRPWNFGAYRVDRNGQFVLIVPDPRDYPGAQPGLPAPANPATGEGAVTVHFVNGAAVADLTAVAFVLGNETTLQQSAVRGAVLDRGIGVPNAAVQIQGEAAAATTARDGSWVYYFALNQPSLPPAIVPLNIAATLPDGRSQTLPGFPVKPRATSWTPAFRFV